MEDWRSAWALDPDVSYLNHGSFGPAPRVVQEAQRQWSARLQANPMKLLVRDREQILDQTLDRLASLLGCKNGDLVPVDNATVGMNCVARTLDLQPEDEILLNSHEYGAVQRIWQQRVSECGARLTIANLLTPIESAEQIVNTIEAAITPRTRLIVVSHVTSATATVFPVDAICRMARQHRVPVCIDGPHAVAMRPVALREIGCDFYTASCHKWLCAPFGAGFLYVHPRWQSRIRPAIVSWGGSTSDRPKSWQDEFFWPGTFDPARFFAIPTAIDFFEQAGWELFRSYTNDMVIRGAELFRERFGSEPVCPLNRTFLGTMVTLSLPDSITVPETWLGTPHPLQMRLAEKHSIEVPVFKWNQRAHIRLSCHLYNRWEEYLKLADAIDEEIPLL
ncbi:MAG: aminotransferase class V-fold PLP-dependent enzyme [Planctomycetaceae bacterium]|nr:aminotransferase class V-fold PLP-dependent enzyme [Planctomycetaceae bacterium]